LTLYEAQRIAEEIIHLLKPVCYRLEVVGSIRRRKPDPKDIEILCIPKADHLLDQRVKELINQGILDYRRSKLGRIAYGPLNKFLIHCPTGIAVDIFSTTLEKWWMSLVIRTGPDSSTMALARAALRKGWRLRAYGDGYDTPQGHIRCHSEREVFELVGLKYKPPEER